MRQMRLVVTLRPLLLTYLDRHHLARGPEMGVSLEIKTFCVVESNEDRKKHLGRVPILKISLRRSNLLARSQCKVCCGGTDQIAISGITTMVLPLRSLT